MQIMANFGKIASQLSAGVKREFLSPSKVRLRLSWGFPYEAFDGQARVKPWHIISLVESGRALSFNQLPGNADHTFLSVDRLYAHHNLFQGSAKLEISKAMYDISLPKTPVTLEKELVYVGHSSMNVKTDVIQSSVGVKLASCEVQSVLVNKETRKPVPFPEWWMEMYGSFSSPQKQLKVLVEKEPRAGTASQSSSPVNNRVLSGNEPITNGVSRVDMVVCAGDTDVYGHANWSAFLKYCIEAISVVACQCKSDYMLRRVVKSAKLSYCSEGSMGQKIQVHFWRSASTPDCVHFQVIECKNNGLLSYAVLEFYQPEDLEFTSGAKL